MALAGCAALYVPEEPASSTAPVAAPAPAEPDPAPVPERERGTVARVLAGDLIELADGRRVRYLGVVAPQPGEPWFDESRGANHEMVGGREIEFARDPALGLSPDGALLAHVYVAAGQFLGGSDGGYVFANHAMVASGSARASTLPERYRFRFMLLQAEARARERAIGIWQGGGS